MYIVKKYKLKCGTVCPTGGFYHGIYGVNSTIKSLNGEFSRAKYVINQAVQNLQTHTTTDRSLMHGLIPFIRRTIRADWNDINCGIFSDFDLAKAFCIKDEAQCIRQGLTKIRRKSFANNGTGLKKPSNNTWGNPFHATQQRLYSTVEMMCRPLNLSNTQFDTLKKAAYKEYVHIKSPILTRGDLYLYLCNELNISY